MAIPIGLQGQARGDTEGGELNVLFGTGYDVKLGGLTSGPTATFNCTYLGADEFTEHGSLAPLRIHGGESESIRSAFGVRANYDWKCGGVVIKPEVRAAWQHEYGDVTTNLTSSFAEGAEGSFLSSGPRLGRDSFSSAPGLRCSSTTGHRRYLYYDGELGRSNYESNSVTGGLRVAF